MVRRLEWTPTYELGVEGLDNDHQYLFGLAREICEAVDKADFGQCRTRTEGFIDALKKHFAMEEEFLERIGYPDTDAHKDFHKTLVTKAEKLKKLCTDGGEHSKIQECYSDTTAVMLDEIIRGDAMFKSYIEYHGIDRSPIE